MNDQLGLGTCGATTRLPSYGHRVCVMPAGHQPPLDQPSTSTEGWHQSADYLRLAEWRCNDPGLRAKVLRVDKPKAVPDGQLDIFGGEAA